MRDIAIAMLVAYVGGVIHGTMWRMAWRKWRDDVLPTARTVYYRQKRLWRKHRRKTPTPSPEAASHDE